jgi:hypothetical protein
MTIARTSTTARRVAEIAGAIGKTLNWNTPNSTNTLSLAHWQSKVANATKEEREKLFAAYDSGALRVW